jgi:hypothetical protein
MGRLYKSNGQLFLLFFEAWWEVVEHLPDRVPLLKGCNAHAAMLSVGFPGEWRKK